MDPFSDDLHLRQVVLEGLDLHVRVAEDGSVNLGQVLVPAERPEVPEEPPAPPRPLVLDDLRMSPPARCRFYDRCLLADAFCRDHDHPPLEDKGGGHKVACYKV